jgi:hypothetical protein
LWGRRTILLFSVFCFVAKTKKKKRENMACRVSRDVLDSTDEEVNWDDAESSLSKECTKIYCVVCDESYAVGGKSWHWRNRDKIYLCDHRFVHEHCLRQQFRELVEKRSAKLQEATEEEQQEKEGLLDGGIAFHCSTCGKYKVFGADRSWTALYAVLYILLFVLFWSCNIMSLVLLDPNDEDSAISSRAFLSIAYVMMYTDIWWRGRFKGGSRTFSFIAAGVNYVSVILWFSVYLPLWFCLFFPFENFPVFHWIFLPFITMGQLIVATRLRFGAGCYLLQRLFYRFQWVDPPCGEACGPCACNAHASASEGEKHDAVVSDCDSVLCEHCGYNGYRHMMLETPCRHNFYHRLCALEQKDQRGSIFTCSSCRRMHVSELEFKTLAPYSIICFGAMICITLVSALTFPHLAQETPQGTRTPIQTSLLESTALLVACVIFLLENVILFYSRRDMSSKFFKGSRAALIGSLYIAWIMYIMSIIMWFQSSAEFRATLSVLHYVAFGAVLFYTGRVSFETCVAAKHWYVRNCFTVHAIVSEKKL